MALNIIKRLTKCNSRCLWKKNSMVRSYAGLWEPDYLEVGKSDVPLHPTLNVKINGYDYPVLESYQKFVHTLAEYMDLDVEDSWAFPAKHYSILKYKPRTTAEDTKYKLSIYERDIQISNVKSTTLPMFLRILESTLPEGVHLKVDTYDSELNKKRYIPDKELLDLKAELETIGKK